MIVVSYDIADDRLRLRFSKYLKRFGHRIQYSVFEIKNSARILDNIMNDIANKYEKEFSQSDSILIFNLSTSCKIVRYGYAKNDEDDILIV
jgi:CRISPR-associated protein Cas2